MLYDKNMEGKRSILIKQRNGISYRIFTSPIGEYDACVFSRDDQFQALSDRRGIFLSDTPIKMAICERVVISTDSVYVLALDFSEHTKQKRHRQIGCYSLNLDEIDMETSCVAGEVIIDDVESIATDPEYFIALLNTGTISIDNEAMKAYDLTPRWVLYRNNPENPKKYIK